MPRKKLLEQNRFLIKRERHLISELNEERNKLRSDYTSLLGLKPRLVVANADEFMNLERRLRNFNIGVIRHSDGDDITQLDKLAFLYEPQATPDLLAQYDPNNEIMFRIIQPITIFNFFTEDESVFNDYENPAEHILPYMDTRILTANPLDKRPDYSTIGLLRPLGKKFEYAEVRVTKQPVIF
jgi:hypothetical protein